MNATVYPIADAIDAMRAVLSRFASPATWCSIIAAAPVGASAPIHCSPLGSIVAG